MTTQSREAMTRMPRYINDDTMVNPLLSYAPNDGFGVATEDYSAETQGVMVRLGLGQMPGNPLPYVYAVHDSGFDDAFNTRDAPNVWLTLSGGNDGVTLGSGSALVTQAPGAGRDAFVFHAGAQAGDMLEFKHADTPGLSGAGDFLWFFGFGGGAHLQAVGDFAPQGYAGMNYAGDQSWHGYEVLGADGQVLLGPFGVAFLGEPRSGFRAGDVAFG